MVITDDRGLYIMWFGPDKYDVKPYVGATTSLSRRIKKHYAVSGDAGSLSNSKSLKGAWAEYGEPKRIDILPMPDFTWTELLIEEYKLTEKLDSVKNGYNLHNFGKNFSPETHLSKTDPERWQEVVKARSAKSAELLAKHNAKMKAEGKGVCYDPELRLKGHKSQKENGTGLYDPNKLAKAELARRRNELDYLVSSGLTREVFEFMSDYLANKHRVRQPENKLHDAVCKVFDNFTVAKNKMQGLTRLGHLYAKDYDEFLAWYSGLDPVPLTDIQKKG